jgi:methyl-accepting chemotaxis protein
MTEATIRTLPRTGDGVRHPVAQLDQLERELRHSAPAVRETAIEDLGRMSADAVLAQYESAAREFEVMGEEVKDRIEKLRASLEEADASMKLLTEAAKAIRDKGKLAHAQIEEMSNVAKVIQGLHADVMKKITG